MNTYLHSQNARNGAGSESDSGNRPYQSGNAQIGCGRFPESNLVVTCVPQRPPKESGQGTVEFALISVVLMVTIFAIVDLGRAMSIYSFLAGAAQAGARAGAVSSETAVIEAAAQTRMSGFDTGAMTIVVDQSGNYTEVTLTYVFVPVTPLVASLGTDALTMSNTARVRKLGNNGGQGGGAQATPGTPVATSTPGLATSTPGGPTNTPAPPTSTPVVTNTPVPPTSTPMPPTSTPCDKKNCK